MNYKFIVSTENNITEIRYLPVGSTHWQTIKINADPISLVEDLTNYVKCNYENE